MVRRFAAGGMRVVVADVDGELAAEAAREVDGLGMAVDVRRVADVERLRDAALEAYGRVDLVCNNAGVTTSGRIRDLSLDEWRWILEVNLWGVIHGVHTFLPVLEANPEGGHLVNTASGAGLAPAWANAPYGVSKYGIVGLSEILRGELAEDGSAVAVSVLLPSATATSIVESSRSLAEGVVARAAGDAEREREQHKAQALAAGMAPEAVADLVWEALGDRRFWILPYPAHAQWALDRAREIVAAAGIPADEEEPVR
jgi:NAD(P)-dependent dehydrogenase (short-subunit alcohol dehydrogenase family)